MNPTAATALRWGGAVVGLLLVVWFTVPAMLNALQNSIQFGDEETNVLLEGGGAGEEPAEEAEPADDDAEAAEGEDGDEEADDDGDGGGNDDGDEADDDGNDDEADDGGGGGEDGSAGQAAVVDGRYEVQPGDTLFSISEQVLGDGHRWSEIAELNGLADGRDLRVGQVLELPDN